MRNTKKKARDKIWWVISGIVILAGSITLAVVFWPKPEKESAVLMLSTYNEKNVPWVISMKGKSDLKWLFSYSFCKVIEFESN